MSSILPQFVSKIKLYKNPKKLSVERKKWFFRWKSDLFSGSFNIIHFEKKKKKQISTSVLFDVLKIDIEEASGLHIRFKNARLVLYGLKGAYGFAQLFRLKFGDYLLEVVFLLFFVRSRRQTATIRRFFVRDRRHQTWFGHTTDGIQRLIQLADELFVVDASIHPDVEHSLNIFLDVVVAHEWNSFYETLFECVLENFGVLALTILNYVIRQVEQGQTLLAYWSYLSIRKKQEKS